MADNTKRFLLVVSGDVQGVGYRFFTKDTALDLGITGWVRNCVNGDVEVEAQGDEKQLDLFLGELKKGPRMCRVAGVTIGEIAVEKEASGFVIYQ